MLYYILYYDPELAVVGPFEKRQDAIEWALSSERKRERPTLWVISPSTRYYNHVSMKVEDPNETRPA